MGKEQLNNLGNWIATELTRWKVPGIAIAVVQDGEVIHSQGYGYRDLEAKQPVTSDTLFAIGSASKAFTGMSVAMMVEDGKLKWEQPVREVMATFELKDSFASSRMNARDLLCHRSGLPRHDLMWYASPFNRGELFERLKHLEPTTDFRSTWQYQNLMYLSAGYLVEQITGSSWESVVADRIFKPLGMNHSNFSVNDMQQAADRAIPHQEKDGVVVQIPYRNIDAIGPAGSINSNLTDMVRWVQFMLDNGKVGDQQIISEANVRELYRSHSIIEDPYFKLIIETNFLEYGLGWFLQDYRGHRVVHHGGNIDGFSAMVSFIPAQKIGVVLLTNLNSNMLTMASMFHIYDCLLGLEQTAWGEVFKSRAEHIQGLQKSGIEELLASRKPETRPGHAMEEYTGTFEHPAYGTVQVQLENGTLKATRNGFNIVLEHHHYEIFAGKVDDMEGVVFMTTFHTDLQGAVSSMGMALQPGVGDIIFQRVPVASAS
jgi:CubicO group peptidase (beta-lactamase class C family)